MVAATLAKFGRIDVLVNCRDLSPQAARRGHGGRCPVPPRSQFARNVPDVPACRPGHGPTAEWRMYRQLRRTGPMRGPTPITRLFPEQGRDPRLDASLSRSSSARGNPTPPSTRSFPAPSSFPRHPGRGEGRAPSPRRSSSARAHRPMLPRRSCTSSTTTSLPACLPVDGGRPYTRMGSSGLSRWNWPEHARIGSFSAQALSSRSALAAAFPESPGRPGPPRPQRQPAAVLRHPPLLAAGVARSSNRPCAPRSPGSGS